jgi:hypothetical protein
MTFQTFQKVMWIIGFLILLTDEFPVGKTDSINTDSITRDPIKRRPL